MSRSTNPVNARALACLFPHYCKDSGIGHIFHSLGVHWTSDRLRATMIVPNAAADLCGPALVEAVPDWLKWMVYRTPGGARYAVERHLLQNLRLWDAVYCFPDISLRTLRRIKQRGRVIFLEMLNCIPSKTRRILEPEYHRLAAQPANPFDRWSIEPPRAAAELADFIFCPSPEVAQSLVETGVPAGKLIAATFGWSPARFPAAVARREAVEEVTVLFAGDICVRKGAHLLLRMWQGAGIKGRLILCGTIEPAIAKAVPQLLRQPGVVHVPYQSDIGPMYTAADIFAFPSLEEGGPLVTYEAMAHGLPVLASPMAAGAVVRNAVDGLVIPPHDTEAWIAALRMLAGSADLRARYGTAGKIRADEFTWKKVAARRADTILQRLTLAP